jgi:hypothetical protein
MIAFASLVMLTLFHLSSLSCQKTMVSARSSFWNRPATFTLLLTSLKLLVVRILSQCLAVRLLRDLIRGFGAGAISKAQQPT